MAQTKRRVKGSLPALEELDEIAAYIALDNVDAAAKLVGKCFETTDRLERYPDAGRFVPELLPNKRYRELVVPPCRVIYRRDADDKLLVIVTVLRGEQLLRPERLH